MKGASVNAYVLAEYEGILVVLNDLDARVAIQRRDVRAVEPTERDVSGGRLFAFVVVNNLFRAMERYGGIGVLRAGRIIPDIRVAVRILLGGCGLRVSRQGGIVVVLWHIVAVPSNDFAQSALRNPRIFILAANGRRPQRAGDVCPRGAAKPGKADGGVNSSARGHCYVVREMIYPSILHRETVEPDVDSIEKFYSLYPARASPGCVAVVAEGGSSRRLALVAPSRGPFISE